MSSPALNGSRPISEMSGGNQPSGYGQQSPLSPGLPSVREVEQEPVELWGGYVPYRPPQQPSVEATSGSESKAESIGAQKR